MPERRLDGAIRPVPPPRIGDGRATLRTAQAPAEFQVEDEVGDLPVDRLALPPQCGEPGLDILFRQTHPMFPSPERNV
ncbi:hypothetical protein [Methylobacterium sp.]|uniref:hypothetical protein n=1 Tax=Methylobacterium sp. TaxID=409 RepID=UPI003B00A051